MNRRAARVWLGYQAGTWFAFQTSATATMVFLITELHLNPLELTLVGTALEITVTLCEIPTGVVADTVSRKLSIVIGLVLLGTGFLLYAVPNYAVVLVAQVVGVDRQTISDAVQHVHAAFGRAEELDVHGKHVRILLSKNPAGMNETMAPEVMFASDNGKLWLALRSGDAGLVRGHHAQSHRLRGGRILLRSQSV